MQVPLVLIIGIVATISTGVLQGGSLPQNAQTIRHRSTALDNGNGTAQNKAMDHFPQIANAVFIAMRNGAQLQLPKRIISRRNGVLKARPGEVLHEEVLVAFVVGIDGSVEDAVCISGSEAQEVRVKLEALETVKRWVFAPARVDNRAIAFVLTAVVIVDTGMIAVGNVESSADRRK